MTRSVEASASWEIEGGERRGGPNTLPRWSVFTQEFPDTTGVTGAGIITHSKTTFAYLQAEEPVARMMIAAPELLEALRDAELMIRRWVDDGLMPETDPTWTAMKAAIAKAQGRS